LHFWDGSLLTPGSAPSFLSMFTIATHDDVAALRKQAGAEKNDDLLGAAEAIDHALRCNVLTFPLTLTMPDPPDGVMSIDGKPVLAVEVRRVTWMRLRHVEAQATPWRIDEHGNPIRGDVVELNLDLCVDEPARREHGTPKGSRTGHFHAIKAPGEPLDGDGWTGGEQETVTLEALKTAVADKQAKFSTYAAAAPHVWLFLIHDALVGVWDVILSDPTLKEQTRLICAKSDFDRVLLFRFGSGVTELWKK